MADELSARWQRVVELWGLVLSYKRADLTIASHNRYHNTDS